MRCKVVNIHNEITNIEVSSDKIKYNYNSIPLFGNLSVIFDEDIYIDVDSKFHTRIKSLLNRFLTKPINNSCCREIEYTIMNLLYEIRSEGWLIKTSLIPFYKRDYFILNKDILFETYK